MWFFANISQFHSLLQLFSIKQHYNNGYSVSVIRKVQAGLLRTQRLDLVRRSIRGVTQNFVPGHADFRGNERVDRLADLATISEGSPMDHTDITNNLGNSWRAKDFKRS